MEKNLHICFQNLILGGLEDKVGEQDIEECLDFNQRETQSNARLEAASAKRKALLCKDHSP
jgi:hypothetical protein